jgi:hypothetical protein
MELVPLSSDGRVAVRGAVTLPAGPLRVVLRLDGDGVVLEALGPAGPRRVGRLAPTDGAAYGPVLARLAARGLLGTCLAQVTGEEGGSVELTLALAPAESCVLGSATGELVLLAAERTVTVTREEHHQDVLARHSGRVAVALVPCTITDGRYAGHAALEVRLDGRRVGELTRLMSERYGPLTDAVAARGGRPGCEALLRRGDRGVQVELRLPAVDVEARHRAGPAGGRPRHRAGAGPRIAVPAQAVAAGLPAPSAASEPGPAATRRPPAAASPGERPVAVPRPRSSVAAATGAGAASLVPVGRGAGGGPSHQAAAAGGTRSAHPEPAAPGGGAGPFIPAPRAAGPRHRSAAPSRPAVARRRPTSPAVGSRPRLAPPRTTVTRSPVPGLLGPTFQGDDPAPGLTRRQRRRILWGAGVVAAVLLVAALLSEPAEGPGPGAPTAAAATPSAPPASYSAAASVAPALEPVVIPPPPAPLPTARVVRAAPRSAAPESDVPRPTVARATAAPGGTRPADAVTATADCDPAYGGCVPVARDVDCAGGSGDGPAYVRGPVDVVGDDHYGLDHDDDGVACE